MIQSFINQGGDAPIGSVIAYAGIVSTPVSSPPDNQQPYTSIQQTTGITNNIEASGWIVCDGRLLYCRAYPELFQAIGFLYSLSGEPTEVTNDLPADQTFRIPDYRGYFLRGAAGNSGNDPDQDQRLLANEENASSDNINKIGTFQEDAFQTHEHQYSETSETSEIGGTTGGPVSLATETPAFTSPPADTPDADSPVRVSTETRSKNAYVHHLIKYAYVR
ncbi:phage tail protein [uncultured Aquimarina sp.]|uniref:phage tail protein n=1 Tax=uncultured Aquimarina sp. TaxID=575652 RepID=UPI002628A489|nr:phage tail protein [uncultured Aquimarina sp.]